MQRFMAVTILGCALLAGCGQSKFDRSVTGAGVGVAEAVDEVVALLCRVDPDVERDGDLGQSPQQVVGHPHMAAGAVEGLRTIVTAQTMFREGDVDRNGRNEYATLAQLSQTQLVDEYINSIARQS